VVEGHRMGGGDFQRDGIFRGTGSIVVWRRESAQRVCAESLRRESAQEG
jgi:hypothetical protein